MNKSGKRPKFHVGDTVRFSGYVARALHNAAPDLFPPEGTVGKVLSVRGHEDAECLVQWPDWTTSRDDRWTITVDCLELVERGLDAFQPGDRVQFSGLLARERHSHNPKVYPPEGTFGTVDTVHFPQSLNGRSRLFLTVKWESPEGKPWGETLVRADMVQKV